MRKFGKELIGSLRQAARHAVGKNVHGLRASKVENVKATRTKKLPKRGLKQDVR
jgi:hypothetical protein